MKRSTPFIVDLLIALAVWALPCSGRAQAQASAPVIITLMPEVTVDDSLVTIEQIARLSGGPDYLRKRLASLDVADFKIGAAFVTVSADQVHFRLLLAGLDEAQVRVRGADRTLVVESRGPVTLRKILAGAERALRADYPGDTSALTLVPHRGIEVPALELRAGDRVHFQAKARTPLASSGRAAIDVTLSVNGKVREVVPVFFEMLPLELPVRSAAKERSAIRPASFSSPVVPARDFLIKSGDNVKLIAKVGSARLEALGEAQQNGRVGDVIRVRNVESSRVVHGRVEPSGMVLVEY